MKKNKKKNTKKTHTHISVTVTYLLISKTDSSESSSELSSMAELTRVQADVRQRYMKNLFNTRLLYGETGRLTKRARNRRSNARRIFSRSSPFFGLLCLVFSSFCLAFFFFFSKIKKTHVPNTSYTCFLSDDEYQTIIYNREINITES